MDNLPTRQRDRAAHSKGAAGRNVLQPPPGLTKLAEGFPENPPSSAHLPLCFQLVAIHRAGHGLSRERKRGLVVRTSSAYQQLLQKPHPLLASHSEP